MSKKFKLLKDLPDVKAGEIFTRRDGDEQHYWGQTKCSDGAYSKWPIFYVESNPSWWQEVVEREWEIVALKGVDKTIMNKSSYGEFTWNQLVSYPELTIHSVKRLSDNEVFSVGDWMEFNMYGIEKGPIQKFSVDSITPTHIYAHYQYVQLPFPRWKKLPPQQSKQPEQEIIECGLYKYSTGYTMLSFPPSVSDEKLYVIKQAVDAVINEFEYHIIPGFAFTHSKWFTEKQLNEERKKVWRAARLMMYKDATPRELDYHFKSFQDFLNSIK